MRYLKKGVSQRSWYNDQHVWIRSLQHVIFKSLAFAYYTLLEQYIIVAEILCDVAIHLLY